MANPTIVIIPGSFSPPSMYTTFASHLQSKGFETIVGTLATASRTPPSPAATMEDDASHFHDLINALANEGKDVIVVAHSYGGIVANQSAKGLLKTDRAAFGKPGGIVRLVFISSVVPALGLSVGETVGKVELDFISVQGDYMTLDVEGSAKANFSDIPLEEALPLASLATMHSALSFAGKLTYAAYEHAPVSFIFCERDGCLPPAFQRDTIKLIEEKSGQKVSVFNIDSGHSVNMTRPGELAGLVQQAIRA